MKRLTALSSLLLFAVACNKVQSTAPEPVVAAVAAGPAAEPAPPKAEPKPEDLWLKASADDVIVVGTFNTTYAFDDDERSSERQAERQAKSYEDWEWKRDAIVKALLQQNMDIFALQGLGGEAEAADIFSSLRQAGGKSYEGFDYAFIESTDRFSGEHVAIFSRYPMFDARRVSKGVKQHLAADITLPGGQPITVLTMKFGRGTNASAAGRRIKGAQSLRRTVARMAKETPVVLLGGVGESQVPDDDGYRRSVAGTLAGIGGKKGDPCKDSAEFSSAQGTHLDGRTLDRVFTCGLEMASATTSGRDQIVYGAIDPDDQYWSEIPIAESPKRDASRHLVVRSEIKLPAGHKRSDAAEAQDEQE